MKTRTIEVYEIDELSDRARGYAHENWLNNCWEYFYAEENQASLEAFARHFGLELKYSRIPDGIIFFNMDSDVEDLRYVRVWKYILNNRLETISKDDKSSHLSFPIVRTECTIYDSCPLTGFHMDEYLLDPVRRFMEKPQDITFRELMVSCIESFEDAKNADYEDSRSMDYFLDHAKASDYEFDINGNRL